MGAVIEKESILWAKVIQDPWKRLNQDGGKKWDGVVSSVVDDGVHELMNYKTAGGVNQFTIRNSDEYSL